MKPLRAMLVLVALALTALADVLEVPGDHADLQAALDAAQPDDTIVVHGGIWRTLVVSKPVRIVGAPRPMIEGETQGIQHTPPIRLSGPGSGTVVLSNIAIGGFADGNISVFNSPGIDGGGFSELHVVQSEVRAPRWRNLSGLGVGARAIDVDVSLLVVDRSFVAASPTDIDDTFMMSGVDGPTGVFCLGVVVPTDSTILGGDSAQFCHPTADCAGGCPGGEGGVGVWCNTLYSSASTIQGGNGAVWKDLNGTPCCTYTEGAPVLANTHVALANDLVGLGRMRLADTFELQATTTGPTGMLLMATELVPPVQTGFGPLFLGNPTLVATFSTPGVVRVRFPAAPELAGIQLGFQVLDSADGLTRPVTGAVAPARPTRSPAPTVFVEREL